MEGKKISFGFSKTRRAADNRLAAPIQPHADEERREYIECVEEKSIKVVGGEEVVEKKPLIIPLKPNTLVTAERLQQIASEIEDSIKEEQESRETTEKVIETPKPENETLEQQAARELLEEARNLKKVETSVLTVPMPKLPPLRGEKESTLEDYESVPVSDFGMAMLRGMGWTPGKESKFVQPAVRPKGLGLGADKLVKGGDKKKGEAPEEELKLQKGSLVRVVAGKHAGTYGKVVSLDEESGRALVEPAVKGACVSVGEQTLQPVTRKHYDDNCRVINSDKYEEYKKKENLSNEKKERSASKKSYHKYSGQSTSNYSDNSRQKQSVYRSGEECRNPGNYSNEDDKIGVIKDRKNDDRNARRCSSESENEKNDSKTRNHKSNQNRTRHHSSESEDESRDRISAKNRYSHTRRSRSRDSRDGSNCNSKRGGHFKSSSNENRAEQKWSSNTKRSEEKHSSSSEGEITERKSRKGDYERNERRTSTNSDDGRARSKHKSKNSHKSRELSIESESLNSVSSEERRHLKKSKKIREKSIDKKRKGKKKKRDRDHSPNIRKHKR